MKQFTFEVNSLSVHCFRNLYKFKENIFINFKMLQQCILCCIFDLNQSEGQ